MPRTTCPKCGAVLELTDDMVNQQIECGACQAIFVAKPDAPASRRGPDEDRPSRRPRDEDDRPSRRRDEAEDDRPSRRRRDEDDEIDRPSRRRRFEDDEDDDRPQRRRRSADGGGQGLAIASLVLGIISIVLAICCGGFSLPLSIVGAILGVVHLTQKRSEGNGLAVGGLVACGLAVVVAVLNMVLGFAINAGNFGRQNNGPPFGPQPQNKRPFGR